MEGSTKRKGLGLGLSALLESGTPDVSQASTEITYFNPQQFVTGLYQPRHHFDEKTLQELADSIKTQGILHPLLARTSPSGDIELIAGERRLKAAVLAGLKEIPCRLLPISAKQALEISLLENVQRHDLSPIDEAKGYEKLMTEMAYTQEDLAKKIGKSRAHLANTLRLLKLSPTIQKLLDEGKLSPGHGRALVGQPNAADLAESAIYEGWSVRKLEDVIRGGGSPTSIPKENVYPNNNDALEPEQAKAITSLFQKRSRPQPLEEEIYLAHQLKKITGLASQVMLKKNGGVIQINFQTAEELDTLLANLTAGFSKQTTH